MKMNEIKSRFVWEFVIWPKEVTVVSRTQPSGPLCRVPLGNLFYPSLHFDPVSGVTSDKRSGVLKAGKLFLFEFVQGIGGARTHWTLKSFLQQFPEICSRALLRNSVNLETNQKPHSPLFSLLRNCFHRFLHHFHPFFNHLHLFDSISNSLFPISSTQIQQRVQFGTRLPSF